MKRTILQVTTVPVCMSLDSHVQQSPSWVEHARQKIHSVDRILPIFLNGSVDDGALRILDSTAAGETVSGAEDVKELVMGEACDAVLFGSHLTRKH